MIKATLSRPDIITAMLSDNFEQLIIAAQIDKNKVKFLTAALEVVCVPVSFFDCELKNLSIVDNGLTIRFGQYEIASEVILANNE